MYKSFLLYLLFSALLLPYVRGQEITEFAPVGAQWVYHTGYATITHDTVIEGKTCKVMITGSYYPFYKRIYWHQAGDKVYCYDQNAFHLVYDFGLEAGDTLFAYTDPLWIAYNNNLYNANMYPQYVIDSVGTITIGNTTLRKQWLRPLPYPSGPFPWEWHIGQIIENIGHNFRPFPVYGLAHQYSIHYLLCYSPDKGTWHKIDSKGWYPDYDCEAQTPLSRPEVPQNMEAICYPNPFQNSFRVEISEPITHLKIYNGAGKLIYQQSEPQAGTEYGTELPAGVYYVYLQTESNFISRVLIKE